MRRHGGRAAWILLALAWVGLALAGCTKSTAPRPHIVLVLADDLGYGDVSAYNPDSRIETPHIDALAEQGIRMTDAHSPSAVCTPARYGLLTGRYAWRTELPQRVFFNYEPPLIEEDRLTLASLLRRYGYATALVGKWHLGLGFRSLPGPPFPFERPLPWPSANDPELEKRIDFDAELGVCPLDHGFDYAFYTAGCPAAQPPYGFIEGREFVETPSRWLESSYLRGSRSGMAAPGWDQREADTTLVERAVAWLDGFAASGSQDPFFLFLSLNAPHDPPLPPAFIEGRSGLGPRGDMVLLADWALGRVAETLERLDLDERTLLIFTSDNGPRPVGGGHESAAPWRGLKSHTWEGGHRVPFIARWPGRIPAGATSDEPIDLVDLLGTFAALLGEPLPEAAGEDSYDVLPALLGKSGGEPIREALVSHSAWGAFAIRQGRWKLIPGTRGSGGPATPADETLRHGGYDFDAPGQLYDLQADPGEQTNLYDERPDEVVALRELLQRYIREGRSAPRP